jgi:O-glycosyl hydrolase
MKRGDYILKKNLKVVAAVMAVSVLSVNVFGSGTHSYAGQVSRQDSSLSEEKGIWIREAQKPPRKAMRKKAWLAAQRKTAQAPREIRQMLRIPRKAAQEAREMPQLLRKETVQDLRRAV